MNSNQLLYAFLFLLAVQQISAGPILYSLCIVACNAVCFGGTAAAAVATAGAGAAIGAGCIPGCMSGCLITGVAPTP